MNNIFFYKFLYLWNAFNCFIYINEMNGILSLIWQATMETILKNKILSSFMEPTFNLLDIKVFKLNN